MRVARQGEDAQIINYVDNPDDFLFEKAGEGVDAVYASVSFRLTTGAEIEILRANAGGSPLILDGNEFANQIHGGSGNDRLEQVDIGDVVPGHRLLPTMNSATSFAGKSFLASTRIGVPAAMPIGSKSVRGSYCSFG